MLKRILLTLALATSCAHAQRADTERAKDEINGVLQSSARDWSHGDLRAFMRSYEAGPETAFVTRDGLITGSGNIEAYYARHYAPGPAMGTLSLQLVDYRPLTSALALVTGRFALSRPEAAGGPASGIFTLLFHRGPAGWRIAYDHTS